MKKRLRGNEKRDQAATGRLSQRITPNQGAKISAVMADLEVSQAVAVRLIIDAHPWPGATMAPSIGDSAPESA